MSLNLKKESWVWVFIQNPDKNEEILGQQEEETGVMFIPVFQAKEIAYQCMNLLAKKPGAKYEPQAIIYEDLVSYASENGFSLFVLDGEGKVLEKITP